MGRTLCPHSATAPAAPLLSAGCWGGGLLQAGNSWEPATPGYQPSGEAGEGRASSFLFQVSGLAFTS